MASIHLVYTLNYLIYSPLAWEFQRKIRIMRRTSEPS